MEYFSIFPLPSGWGEILSMYALAFIFGFTYRFVFQKLAKHKVRKQPKNLSAMGRVIRLTLGIGLLILAAYTNWSLWLLFFSGFCIFEGMFSWCIYNAAVGRSEC